MSNPVLIQLPKSCSMPVSGPVFRYAFEKLTVDYDDQEVGGAIVWTRLEFSGVEAMKYTEEGQGGDDDVGEFDQITCWDSSPWLDEMVANWKKNYPRADPNASAPSLHYRLHCDHAGTLHVIASSVKIIENPELDALNTLPPCR